MNELRFLTCALAVAGLALSGCGDDGMMMTTDTGVADSSPMGDADPDTGVMPDGGTEIPPVPALGAQIDRSGRPAISTALMQTFNGDSDAKGMARNDYNESSDPATWADDYADDFAGSLAILDSLDRNCGNQLLADASDDTPARYAMLAGALAADQLSLQSNPASGTCDAGLYLGVEAETLGVLGAGEGGCGGRDLDDDIIERSYSVLAAGALTGIDDTITGDAADHDMDSFPFLAAPN